MSDDDDHIPKAMVMTTYHDRLFVGGDNRDPDRIYCSVNGGPPFEPDFSVTRVRFVNGQALVSHNGGPFVDPSATAERHKLLGHLVETIHRAQTARAAHREAIVNLESEIQALDAMKTELLKGA